MIENLTAQTKIILQPIGYGVTKHSIRRAILLDSRSGLPCEFPTLYIYRNLGQKSLNTHLAILRDLAFFLEWTLIKKSRNPDWMSPETRVKNNLIALTKREIDDFSGWCDFTSKELARIRSIDNSRIHSIPSGNLVDISTSNSRLRNLCNYLIWLTEDFIEGLLNIDDDSLVKSEKYKNIIFKSFEKNYKSDKKPAPIYSLDSKQTATFKHAIYSDELFSNTNHGIRDRLIARFLYETGLRSGECLKLKCTDILDNYEIVPGKFIGIIRVKHKPNDSLDPRPKEPASKTLSGDISVSKNLTNDLIKYITNERRLAISMSPKVKEHQYLFVCHSGPTIGEPISQRNLNRVISKLKSLKDFPEWFSPHTLRHTHFNEIANLAYSKGKDVRSILIQRGRWTNTSTMPSRYSQRHIIDQTAELIQERDRILDGE
ncbi:MAG: site-specific integrase [Methylotenera sp.]|jgi:integrase|uniref:tyrosine-type recombinase/integrase n=1 Tax=Methylotenera sp. L2L1 TaxID=1502770 RepID=UPI0005699FA4|nr:site-specific integrase [Methylotenera sp. L2L1]MDD2834265.1 site-specific integrase [Methylotenera sp.]MDP2102800.1 site-specific integrase [Methylotenera sp.]MDP2282162.1 site-specific integrase [Methylotenera sp.]MDP3061544.1 site-specific integrase [Methylotenera sp.]HOY86682.1 site-specific integrase [Methylotenera sp.]